MSAAEKLKALNVRYNSDIADLPDYGPDDEYGTVIINALPQIVAVVEAAEQNEDNNPLHPLGSALAALDEQLGDLGSPPTSERSTAQ